MLFDRESFLPPPCRELYENWLREHQIGKRTMSERIGRLARVGGSNLLRYVQRATQLIDSAVNLPVIRRLARSGRLTELAHYEPEFNHLFPWALSLAQRDYVDMTDRPATKLSHRNHHADASTNPSHS